MDQAEIERLTQERIAWREKQKETCGYRMGDRVCNKVRSQHGVMAHSIMAVTGHQFVEKGSE